MKIESEAEITNKLEVYRYYLKNIIQSASLHYEIWWSYKEKDSRKRYVDILNKYLDFFHTSLQAHFLAVVVELYKLFETRKDTANFPALTKFVFEKKIVDKNTKNQIQMKLEEIKPLWKKIAILRSELYAHSSIKLTYPAIFKKAKITPNEIKQLIDLSKDLLNLISSSTMRSHHLFSISASEDTKKILDDLLEYDRIISK